MLKKFLFMLMVFPVLSFADTPKGEKLVERLWKDIQAVNIEKIKEYTSKDFQALDGGMARNRYEELDYIKTLDIQTYTLSDIKATQGENIIVVTYGLSAMQDNQAVVFEATLISVWKKYDDQWKWAAHAVFTATVEPGP